MKNGHKLMWIFLQLTIIFDAFETKSVFKFTNLKCEDHDPSFASFEKCQLKVVGRGLVSLNIRVGLYKTPVTNSTINIGLYKRANGYKPFLYNTTENVCAFFANRKKYPIIKAVFDTFLKNSNLNHTCPYNDAIIVKDLILDESRFVYLPLPEGQYLAKANVFAYNDLKATVEVFFYRKDPLI
ncbi:uncharacterized protein LOC142233658 [Haematobia irritans]|uniref:uncharacterized protein LOC142233658 n=1 Tax=Haematobia irritans TaxID=7368 RepID=UPI003F4F46E1